MSFVKYFRNFYENLHNFSAPFFSSMQVAIMSIWSGCLWSTLPTSIENVGKQKQRGLIKPKTYVISAHTRRQRTYYYMSSQNTIKFTSNIFQAFSLKNLQKWMSHWLTVLMYFYSVFQAFLKNETGKSQRAKETAYTACWRCHRRPSLCVFGAVILWHYLMWTHCGRKKTVNVFYCLSINVHVLYFCYIKSFFSIVLRPLYFICIALASRYYFIFVRGTDSIPPFVLFLLFLLLLQRLGLCRFIGSELNLARSFFIDWRVRFLTSYFQDMHTHNAYIRAYIETPAENINCQRP